MTNSDSGSPVRPASGLVDFVWRGSFTDDEVNALHAEAFDHPVIDIKLRAQLDRHSLGWVIARDGEGLVGFVNIAWDGGVHAFVLDTAVALRARHQGIGRQLIAVAGEQVRATGCEWLHVDFEDHLGDFYFDACSFSPTDAGLMRLR